MNQDRRNVSLCFKSKNEKYMKKNYILFIKANALIITFQLDFINIEYTFYFNYNNKNAFQ